MGLHKSPTLSEKFSVQRIALIGKQCVESPNANAVFLYGVAVNVPTQSLSRPASWVFVPNTDASNVYINCLRCVL